jgi:hypothetical protein
MDGAEAEESLMDAPKVLTDAKGRKITLRDLTIMDQMKMLRAIGAAQASNQPYVQMVTVACMVDAIDGVPQPFPTNERGIDAAVSRLGDDGMAVVMMDMITEQNRVMEAAQRAVEGGDAAPDPLAPSGS